MEWSTVMQPAAPLVPEGEYPAVLADVRGMPGRHGMMARLDFTITGDSEWEGCQVSGLANDVLSETSKLGQWVAALLGYMPTVGQEVTSENIRHKDCRIFVKHKASGDQQTFANVVQVIPTDAGE